MSEVKVVVSRAWSDTNIETVITEKDTTLRLGLEDFIAALKLEVRLPELKMQTKKSLEDKEEALRLSIETGVLRVIEKIKAGASKTVRR